jgi:threonine synthase
MSPTAAPGAAGPSPNAPLTRAGVDPPTGGAGARVSRAVGLRCVACGARSPLVPTAACGECLGPLAVEYDLAGSPPAGWPRGATRPPRRLAEFAPLLPPVADAERTLALESTPLRPAPRLAAELGIAELHLKDDTVLPTGSFKDRAATVAVAQAAAWGYRAVGCASTGNLAAATARAATRAGLPSFVFVPRGLPESNLAPVRRFGGTIVEVEGSYDAANRVAFLAGERVGIGVVNVALRPFYTEGSKTLWHETCAALDGRAPDRVIVPLGSGALLAATHRGIGESRRLGFLPVDGAGPALIGTQPEGCSPIVDAFERGTEEIRPVEHPTTIAESLAIGDPASGPEALRAIRTSGGTADRPTADEVRAGIRDLARFEGIWVEPAGGTVVATLRRLRATGAIRSSDRIVAFLTGAGWKSPAAGGDDVPRSLRLDPHRPDWPELEARLAAVVPAPGGTVW